MAEVLIARFEEVWRDVVELCDDFTPAQWSLPTDCPGWTVRDHVSHMIGTERMLLGESPSAANGDAPHVRNDIGKANEAWIATYRDWEGSKLLDEFRAVVARRLDALRALGTEDWDREGFTPEGTGPYRVFMEIRVFDCWYHDQDIREGVDRPGYLEGPVADLSIGRIPGKGMGYVVGKKAAAPPNTTVTFDIVGDPPIVATISVPPEGRAVLLETSPGNPTVRIVTDRRTFTRLAGGRWTGDEARSRGMVQVEGDPELGGRVVDNMAFTI
jgi:uncharacterized protein (TIGR03083 family)